MLLQAASVTEVIVLRSVAEIDDGSRQLQILVHPITGRQVNLEVAAGVSVTQSIIAQYTQVFAPIVARQADIPGTLR